jgi:hypothetical protein
MAALNAQCPDPRRFVRTFLASAAMLAVAATGVVLAADPYGLRQKPGALPGPLMDLNQRYMYPQIARSRLFDAAIFGTSTIRLVDPAELSAKVGMRVANLGMNAATPWEQLQLARLYLREVSSPRLLVMGIDTTWCEPDADAPGKMTTFRSFPPWLYDGIAPADLVELANLKSLEIAGRVALHRVGMMPERIRGDGFEIFTPPESTYDLARARRHIWGGDGTPRVPTSQQPAAAEYRGPLPAIDWLDGFLKDLPRATRAILVMPPVHVAVQAQPGSTRAAEVAACRLRLITIAQRHGAALADFARPSPITREDASYWDPLHYRLPIAQRLTTTIAAIAQGQMTGDDAFDLLAPVRR